MKRRTLFAGPGAGLLVVLGMLLGVSGAALVSTPGEWTLSLRRAAPDGGSNIRVVGLYGMVGAGSVRVQYGQTQANNPNAPIPIATALPVKAQAITGTFQTVQSDASVVDINVPSGSQRNFLTGSSAPTGALMNWDGVQSQTNLVESRAGKSPIVVNGNLTVSGDGSISITNASGTTRFDATNPMNWSDSSNPLRNVLAWSSSRFTLTLGSSDTIIVNGYNVPNSTAAESIGLDIRANLTYQGVGAFVVNVQSGMESRGIQFEGAAQNSSATGLGSAVSVLASQQGDGLAFMTNGRVYVNQQGSFAPTVQGFLYAQGYRDSSTGQPRGVDIVGGNVQGMVVGSQVSIVNNDGTNGLLTDQLMINGTQGTLRIPLQMPGGPPVFSATAANWRESR